MRNLLDTDGENLAVRWFLAMYGGMQSPTIEDMRRHLTASGFGGCWPEWAEQSTNGNSEHLTKAGAQNWLRHLFALEAPATEQTAQSEDAKGAARYGVMREHVGAERTNNGSGPVSFYLYTTKTPPISCKVETDAAIDACLQAGKDQTTADTTGGKSQ